MKSIIVLLSAMLLVALTGCIPDHNHYHSNVKVMTKSQDITHINVKATASPQLTGKSHPGKPKGWK